MTGNSSRRKRGRRVYDDELKSEAVQMLLSVEHLTGEPPGFEDVAKRRHALIQFGAGIRGEPQARETREPPFPQVLGAVGAGR